MRPEYHSSMGGSDATSKNATRTWPNTLRKNSDVSTQRTAS